MSSVNELTAAPQDSQTDEILRNRLATKKLLDLLVLHHGLKTIAAPIKDAGGAGKNADPNPVVEPTYWFSIEDEIADPTVMPMIDDIKRTVCEYFKITHVDLTSNRRMLECARPRMIGMYLARQFTGKSLPEIARRFGKTDHSTTHNAVKRIKQLCYQDWEIAHDVAHLEARFQ